MTCVHYVYVNSVHAIGVLTITITVIEVSHKPLQYLKFVDYTYTEKFLIEILIAT